MYLSKYIQFNIIHQWLDVVKCCPSESKNKNKLTYHRHNIPSGCKSSSHKSYCLKMHDCFSGIYVYTLTERPHFQVYFWKTRQQIVGVSLEEIDRSKYQMCKNTKFPPYTPSLAIWLLARHCYNHYHKWLSSSFYHLDLCITHTSSGMVVFVLIFYTRYFVTQCPKQAITITRNGS